MKKGFWWNNQKLTLGQRMADVVSEAVGSWWFISLVFVFFAFWVGMNVYAVVLRWDPYPFILFNLFLSMIAALQAPIILMSQNRQTERDRFRAQLDYAINKKAEKEVEELQRSLNRIEKALKKKR